MGIGTTDRTLSGLGQNRQESGKREHESHRTYRLTACSKVQVQRGSGCPGLRTFDGRENVLWLFQRTLAERTMTQWLSAMSTEAARNAAAAEGGAAELNLRSR